MVAPGGLRAWGLGRAGAGVTDQHLSPITLRAAAVDNTLIGWRDAIATPHLGLRSCDLDQCMRVAAGCTGQRMAWGARHLLAQRPAVLLTRWQARAAHASAEAPPPPRAGDHITAVGNAYVKHAVKLRESAKYRAQQQRLLLVGRGLIEELAGAAGQPLGGAYAAPSKPGSSRVAGPAVPSPPPKTTTADTQKRTCAHHAAVPPSQGLTPRG